jgi:hypothetical protein
MKSLTRKQRWLAISLFAAVVTLATLTFVSGPFGYMSVCDRCGALRHTTDWMLPFTEIKIYTHQTESDSPLSRTVLEHAIIQPHAHHWLFANGGGHGVRCAIGPGRHIRPTVEFEDFTRTILMLHNHELTALRDTVLRGGLDPDISHLYRSLSHSAPREPTTTQELQRWFSAESDYLNEMVAVFKKR